MPLKIDEVEIGKSYQFANGTVRKVYEIVPELRNKAEAHEQDIVRYEAERWAYDNNRYGGKTRVRVKVREKTKRSDFAKEAIKRLD
jgi:hypothetical protein